RALVALAARGLVGVGRLLETVADAGAVAQPERPGAPLEPLDGGHPPGASRHGSGCGSTVIVGSGQTRASSGTSIVTSGASGLNAAAGRRMVSLTHGRLPEVGRFVVIFATRIPFGRSELGPYL